MRTLADLRKASDCGQVAVTLLVLDEDGEIGFLQPRITTEMTMNGAALVFHEEVESARLADVIICSQHHPEFFKGWFSVSHAGDSLRNSHFFDMVKLARRIAVDGVGYCNMRPKPEDTDVYGVANYHVGIWFETEADAVAFGMECHGALRE